MNSGETVKNTQIQTQAFIYLGPSSMSLIVTEIHDGDVRVIDFLTQPVPLARDVFRNGRISRSTMDRCAQVMGDYMAILREYGSGTDLSTHFVMSNIISEAGNVDVFINRMHVAHGLRGRLIDDGKMTRLIYVKVQETLLHYPNFQKKNTMIVHVGPGNTRILLFEKGRITRYSSHRLGVHRTGEAIGEEDFGDDPAELAVMREHIRGQIDQIRVDYAFVKDLASIILIGEEVQRLRNLFKPGREGRVNVEMFTKVAEKMVRMTTEQRMLAYDADFATVDALLPALIINQSIVRALAPREVIVPTSSYDQEFILSLIRAEQNPGDLEGEVLHFAGILADRYMADKDHRMHVARLCDSLFVDLQDLHRLTEHDRLLLQVAAILHEVGTYISPRHHNKHSQYIILNSEIFGLSRDDVEIVALLARYHRRETPSKSEVLYADLDQTDRMRVSKMAAILRVADALERGHALRVKGVEARLRGRNLELLLKDVRDTTVEEMALRIKGDLFSDIFGCDIVLVPDRR
ncbi:HD domain-containing protein [Akkermansia sp. N21169]|nr:HD domain-containing protein [Akkermansia sp. N21169]MDH3069514.1 HD domain-containing protein [Akkermansia sp. N21169]